MEESIWYNSIGMDEYLDISMAIHKDILSHWVYVDPKNDDDARTDDFWDAEKQQFVAKTFYYYAIIGCIIPLTGWWGDYVMPFKFKCRLTKVKEYYE